MINCKTVLHIIVYLFQDLQKKHSLGAHHLKHSKYDKQRVEPNVISLTRIQTKYVSMFIKNFEPLISKISKVRIDNFY